MFLGHLSSQDNKETKLQITQTALVVCKLVTVISSVCVMKWSYTKWSHAWLARQW